MKDPMQELIEHIVRRAEILAEDDLMVETIRDITARVCQDMGCELQDITGHKMLYEAHEIIDSYEMPVRVTEQKERRRRKPNGEKNNSERDSHEEFQVLQGQDDNVRQTCSND